MLLTKQSRKEQKCATSLKPMSTLLDFGNHAALARLACAPGKLLASRHAVSCGWI